MKKVSRIVLIISLALAVDVVGGFSPRLSMVSSQSPYEVVLSGDRIMESSPAAADFNGDGYKEIVIGGSDGWLYVIEYNGSSWSVAWQTQTWDDLGGPSGSSSNNFCGDGESDIRSAPAIADLENNESSLEIIVSTGGDMSRHQNGGVLIYRLVSTSPLSFAVASGWPQPKLDIVGAGSGASNPDGCWDSFWSTPAVGDIDGDPDGDLEIVVEGFDRRLHAWHHDGSVVSGWPIYRQVDAGPDCLLRGGWSSPALGDIDGDGLPEVVVGTDSPPWDCPGNWGGIDYKYATVWAINGDSSNVPGWPVKTDNNVQSSPALGDIDGDGQLEVVVGSGWSQDGGNGRYVYAWEADGQAVAGWPIATDDDIQAPPALGDIDGDGDLEIVVGGGQIQSRSPSAKLYAWHGDGSAVTGYPIAAAANDPDTSPRDMSYGAVLADYDGDGRVEILVTHLESRGIATVNYNGTSWVSDNDPALLLNTYGVKGSPLVGDLDGDGSLDIAIGGWHNMTTGGVYIQQVSGSSDSQLPWPMFHHDAQRTGRAPLPPRLISADEVRMFHQEGSGDTESTYVTVGNGGDGEFDWTITHTIPSMLQVNPPSGVVTDTVQAQLVITTTGVSTGTWHSWPITVTGMVNSSHIIGSPVTATLYLYVGDVERIYLPIAVRDYSE